MKHHRLSLFLLVISLLVQSCLAGGKNKHGGNNRLMELLTAGIVAKVLQKNDHEGGGGGGGGYYTIPIPLHMGSQRSHSHVTEKIIPIPIPHHTTRIIHINAGSGHHGGGEGGFDHHGGGGYDDHHGGGGGGYEEPGHYDGPGGIGGGDHHDGRHSHRSPTIQQLMFHDSGVYGMPQAPRPPMPPHPAGVLVRRPMVGMMPLHPAMPMGMMPPYPLRAQAHSVVAAAARPPSVRVRHYYPLATVPRHRLLAYPTMPQFRYQPVPPRPW